MSHDEGSDRGASAAASAAASSAASSAASIAANLATVRDRMAAAAEAAGRDPASVRLIAVSKTKPAEAIRAALAAGHVDFGENYAQEVRDKRALLTDEPRIRWHYIGPLQSNKVKYVAGHVALVHSVGSVAILEEIDRRTPAGAVQACLVQVNVAGETQKSGVAPEALPALLDRFAALGRVRCEGLMVIPPLDAAPETTRPHFVALRRLLEQEAARPRDNVQLRELSMGMTGDLEIAIAEGATMVRVGTAIFGARARKI